MIRYHLTAIYNVQNKRKQGYIDDVLSCGKINGDFIELEEKDAERIMREYRFDSTIINNKPKPCYGCIKFKDKLNSVGHSSVGHFTIK